MSVYRKSPPVTTEPQSPVSRARTPVILGLTALMHVAVLGVSAFMQPKAPPAPREVTVMTWEAVQLDNGELGFRNDGLHRARIRGDVAP